MCPKPPVELKNSFAALGSRNILGQDGQRATLNMTLEDFLVKKPRRGKVIGGTISVFGPATQKKFIKNESAQAASLQDIPPPPSSTLFPSRRRISATSLKMPQLGETRGGGCTTSDAYAYTTSDANIGHSTCACCPHTTCTPHVTHTPHRSPYHTQSHAQQIQSYLCEAFPSDTIYTGISRTKILLDKIGMSHCAQESVDESSRGRSRIKKCVASSVVNDSISDVGMTKHDNKSDSSTVSGGIVELELSEDEVALQ